MRPQIKITLRKLVSNLFSGDFTSNQKWTRGPEPMEIKGFDPTVDDPRDIDFKLSAKEGEYLVRLKRAERAGRIIFLIDRSKSGEFGSCEAKQELQALLINALTYAGAHAGCQTAFISFTNRLEEVYWPPQFGIEKACEKAEEIFKRSPKGELTDLNVGLQFINQNPVSCSLVVLISDFLNPFDYKESLITVALKHDLVPVIIRDKKEEELPKLRGFINVEDMESGQRRYLDLAKVCQQDAKHFELFKRLNLNWLTCYTDEISDDTDESLEQLAQKLRRFFEQRKRRRRRW